MKIFLVTILACLSISAQADVSNLYEDYCYARPSYNIVLKSPSGETLLSDPAYVKTKSYRLNLVGDQPLIDLQNADNQDRIKQMGKDFAPIFVELNNSYSLSGRKTLQQGEYIKNVKYTAEKIMVNVDLWCETHIDGGDRVFQTIPMKEMYFANAKEVDLNIIITPLPPLAKKTEPRSMLDVYNDLLKASTYTEDDLRGR